MRRRSSDGGLARQSEWVPFSSASDQQRSINEMLFGISFGYVDQAAAVSDLVVGRIPVSGTDTRL
ncbi:hypothetical protein EMIT0P4_140029 [Pseudomonas sp. IT-P4]